MHTNLGLWRRDCGVLMIHNPKICRQAGQDPIPAGPS